MVRVYAAALVLSFVLVAAAAAAPDEPQGSAELAPAGSGLSVGSAVAGPGGSTFVGLRASPLSDSRVQRVEPYGATGPAVMAPLGVDRLASDGVELYGANGSSADKPAQVVLDGWRARDLRRLPGLPVTVALPTEEGPRGITAVILTKDVVYVAGHSYGAGSSSSSTSGFVMAFLRSSGRLRPEFGEGGIVTLPGATLGDGIALTAKDVVVAEHRDAGSALVAIARTSGRPDAGFGAAGRVATADRVSSVVADAAGRIVALTAGDDAITVARYSASGVPDLGYRASVATPSGSRDPFSPGIGTVRALRAGDGVAASYTFGGPRFTLFTEQHFDAHWFVLSEAGELVAEHERASARDGGFAVLTDGRWSHASTGDPGDLRLESFRGTSTGPKPRRPILTPERRTAPVRNGNFRAGTVDCFTACSARAHADRTQSAAVFLPDAGRHAVRLKLTRPARKLLRRRGRLVVNVRLTSPDETATFGTVMLVLRR